MRREIANSNERRRMQSINAGFQSLRALLPKGEGDKLSKAAILQGTVEYVQELEKERTFLMSQNVKLSRSIAHSCNDSDSSEPTPTLLLPKRKRRKTDVLLELDEGIGGSASPSSQSEGEQEQLVHLKQQLEQERAWRRKLEEELRKMQGAATDHDYTDQELTTRTSRNPHRKSPPSHLTLQEHEIAIRLAPIPEHSEPTNQPLPAVPPPVQQPYHPIPNRSRQTLAAIVEAIRHVEGNHMFQDDPPSPKSKVMNTHPSDEHSLKSSTSDEHSFQSQIISRAPVVQNRAGVIVTNSS